MEQGWPQPQKIAVIWGRGVTFIVALSRLLQSWGGSSFYIIPMSRWYKDIRDEILSGLRDIEEDFDVADGGPLGHPSELTKRTAMVVVNTICDFREHLADKIELGPEGDHEISVTLFFRHWSPEEGKYNILDVVCKEGGSIQLMVAEYGRETEKRNYPNFGQFQRDEKHFKMSLLRLMVNECCG